MGHIKNGTPRQGRRCLRTIPPWMPLDLPTPLLGGLSPAQFMRRHWQKKPLLVRQAWPGVTPPVDRSGAVRTGRQRRGGVAPGGRASARATGALRHGPLPRACCRRSSSRLDLLVQGLDLHVPPRRDAAAPSASCPRPGWTT
jgi:50S ribosomal protein L16 3-hydroxylase